MSRTKCRPNQIHSTASQRASGANYHDEALPRRIFIIFRTPRSAPLFTTQLRVQPSPDVCNGPRGDQAIENARGPRRGWKNASIVENDRRAGLGFSIMERAPRKLGGGERSKQTRNVPLTVSAFNLPQNTHMHSNIFFTFTIKPKKRYDSEHGA